MIEGQSQTVQKIMRTTKNYFEWTTGSHQRTPGPIASSLSAYAGGQKYVPGYFLTKS